MADLRRGTEDRRADIIDGQSRYAAIKAMSGKSPIMFSVATFRSRSVAERPPRRAPPLCKTAAAVASGPIQFVMWNA